MSKTRKLTLWLFSAMVTGELVAALLSLGDKRLNSPVYRGYHVLLMAGAVVLAFMIKSEAVRKIPSQFLREQIWKRVSLLIPVAMFFSFVGTFFNAALIDLRYVKGSYFLSALPFYSIAHILFVVVFFQLSPVDVTMKYPKLISRGRLWVTMLVWPVLSFWMWRKLGISHKPDIWRYMFFAFSLVSMLTVMTSCWVGYIWKPHGFLITLGCFFLLISDYHAGRYSGRSTSQYIKQLMWGLFYVSQLIIMYTPTVGAKSPQPVSEILNSLKGLVAKR